MMTNILVDTNLLVYAYDPRNEAKNERAQQVLRRSRRAYAQYRNSLPA